MADIFQAFLTAFAAIFVFVVGQIIVKFFIEPVEALKKHIGDIADTLIYYSNVIVNPPLTMLYPYSEPTEYADAALSRNNDSLPGEEQFVKKDIDNRKKVSKVLRQKATILISKAHLVNGYRLFEMLGVIPKRSSIMNAHGNLIYLHNQLVEMDPLKNAEVRDEIYDLLNINIKYK